MMKHLVRAIALATLFATGAAAQSVSPFGGFKHDETQPIEIAADSLEVREEEKIAVFRGDVSAQQGTMRLSADELEVNYSGDGSGTGQIRRLQARGNVLVENGAESARGDYADYDVAAGKIRMTGNVTLNQGGNTVSGASLSIDLNTGRGKVDGGSGRVKSVFAPAPKN